MADLKQVELYLQIQGTHTTDIQLHQHCHRIHVQICLCNRPRMLLVLSRTPKRHLAHHKSDTSGTHEALHHIMEVATSGTSLQRH